MHLILLIVVAIVAAGIVFFLSAGRLGDRRRRPTALLEVTTPAAPDASLRDEVTGLYNRGHLLVRLQENMARCSRSRERMALILWDIDGFMAFNNAFGQQEGDRFLKRVGETIRGCLRRYDEAFRSGSDDFCAILIPADETVAADVTQRVKETVSKHLFEGDSEFSGREFSISAGLVFYPGNATLPEDLLHAAEQALYKAHKRPPPS